MADEDGVLKELEDLVAGDTIPVTEATYLVPRLNRQRQTTETLVERENREIIEMRGLWSRWILRFIGLIIIFDIVLVACYGLRYWSFSDSKVVIAVITENFLKIFGLGFLITHRLFNKIFSSTTEGMEK